MFLLFVLTYSNVQIKFKYIGFSLCANPLARSPGQIKLDSDKLKL